MAKRFTDTDKWKKPFLRGLDDPYKLLWLYILDECDHAGIWHVDIEVAQIKIGVPLNIQKATELFKNHIYIIPGEEKWFIRDFITFQYGELNPDNRAHRSVLTILQEEGVLSSEEKNKPLISPLQRGKDKDKDMVKDKDKDKGGVGEKKFNPTIAKELFELYSSESIWIQQVTMKIQVTMPERTIELLRRFLEHQSLSNNLEDRTDRDIKNHFLNWVNANPKEKEDVIKKIKQVINGW